MAETLTRRLIPGRNRLPDSNLSSSHQREATLVGDAADSDDEGGGVVLPLHYLSSVTCIQRMARPPCVQLIIRCSRQACVCANSCSNVREKRKNPNNCFGWNGSCCAFNRFIWNPRHSVARDSPGGQQQGEREQFILPADTVDTDEETPDSNRSVPTLLTSSIVNTISAVSREVETSTEDQAISIELSKSDKKRQSFQRHAEAINIAQPGSVLVESSSMTTSPSQTTPVSLRKVRSIPFVDYSRYRAVIPTSNPIIASQMDNYHNVCDEDETSVADRDYFPPLPGHPNDSKIAFLLKVPKSYRHGNKSSLHSNKLLSETVKVTSSPSMAQGPRPATKPISGRSLRQSNSSGSTDMIENLTEPDLSLGSHAIDRSQDTFGRSNSGSSPATTQTPMILQKGRRHFVDVRSMSPTIPFSGLNQPVDMGFVEETVVPLKFDDQPIYDRTLHTKGCDSDGDYRSVESGGMKRYVHSDNETGKVKESQQKKARQRRRSSFVAGSKISRFDGGTRDGSCGHTNRQERTRKQLRKSKEDLDSYAEWKIDLMVNGYGNINNGVDRGLS